MTKKWHKKPRGLTDEEMEAKEAAQRKASGVLTDDEIAAAEARQRSKPLSADEKTGWQFARPLDFMTFGYAPEILAGFRSLLSDETYDSALDKAEDIKQRYNDQVPFDDAANLASGALGFAAGGGPASMLFKGIRGGTKVVRSAAGMTPEATSITGKAVQNVAAAGGTGAAAAGAYEMSDMPNHMSIPEKIMNIDPVALGVGAAAGPVLGLGARGLVKAGQAIRQTVRPDEHQAARWIADRMIKTGKTPNDLRADMMNRTARTGQPSSMADVAPPPLSDDIADIAAQAGAQGDKGTMAKIGVAIAEIATSGSVSGFLHKFGMSTIASILRKIGRGKREKIAEMLFSKDPDQVREAARMIQAEMAAAQRGQQARQTATTVGIAQGGGNAGAGGTPGGAPPGEDPDADNYGEDDPDGPARRQKAMNDLNKALNGAH